MEEHFVIPALAESSDHPGEPGSLKPALYPITPVVITGARERGRQLIPDCFLNANSIC